MGGGGGPEWRNSLWMPAPHEQTILNPPFATSSVVNQLEAKFITVGLTETQTLKGRQRCDYHQRFTFLG